MLWLTEQISAQKGASTGITHEFPRRFKFPFCSHERQTACKPGSVPALRRGMAIHLGRPSPSASRDRPGRRRGSPPGPAAAMADEPAVPTWSCSRWGLPCRRRCRRRGALLPHHFTLAAPRAPDGVRGLAVCFCGTFPRVAPAGRYPAPCFHGARTFLPSPCGRKAAIRPSGRCDYSATEGGGVKFHRMKRQQRRCGRASRHRRRRRSATAGNGAGRR